MPPLEWEPRHWAEAGKVRLGATVLFVLWRLNGDHSKQGNVRTIWGNCHLRAVLTFRFAPVGHGEDYDRTSVRMPERQVSGSYIYQQPASDAPDGTMDGCYLED